MILKNLGAHFCEHILIYNLISIESLETSLNQTKRTDELQFKSINLENGLTEKM